MQTINVNTGGYVALIGLAVAILSNFGIILDANQVGATIHDISVVIGDLMIIWGALHSWYSARQAGKAAKALGSVGIKGIK